MTDSELRKCAIAGMLYAPAYGGAEDGAGVYAVSSTISGCTIKASYARRAGGGAYLDGCMMDRCIIAGNRAVVWGEGLPVEEVAMHAGTIPYELLCGVSQRVPLELK